MIKHGFNNSHVRQYNKIEIYRLKYGMKNLDSIQE